MNKYLTEIENKLDFYFGKKAPAMPENIKELIVKYSPYLTILVMIIAVPTILFAFGVGSAFSSIAYLTGSFRPLLYFESLLALVAIVLEFLALPGLFKRTKKAWQFMFYATLVGLLNSLIGVKIFDLILDGLISFYILFQIKSYYKN
ncbi:MAG: hypothetical protein WC784_01660 [Candidatus Shapirobacteria bacterium]|jgi:lysylphosphatidylglycerol synthetase-like protein (DUF2156 family)